MKYCFISNTESFVGYHAGLNFTATDFNQMMSSDEIAAGLKYHLLASVLQFDFINEIDTQKIFDAFISDNTIDNGAKEHLYGISLLLNSKLLSENQYSDVMQQGGSHKLFMFSYGCPHTQG